LLAGIIRAELSDGMRQLRTAFGHLNQLRDEGLITTTLGGQAVFDEATQVLADLAEKMEMLACLSESHSRQRESNQERLFIYSLLGEIVGARPAKTSSRFVVKEPQADVAPVYGNRHWLKLLLTQLLRELDANINPAERIVFTLRQLGNHMVLASSTEVVPTAERNRTKPPPLPDGGLVTSFCQRIVDLHGGTLRLQFEDDGAENRISGMTLSLPTSAEGLRASGPCAQCPLVEQIECYATDLAVLMDRCERLESEGKPHA